MSLLEQFRDLESQVAQRLRELEPMVAEYRELERVAERLGLHADNGAERAIEAGGGDQKRQTARRAPRPTRPGSRSARQSRARRAGKSRSGSTAPEGQRRDQLLALIKQRPGLTVTQAGEELGVNSTGLYRVVRRLESDGLVRKDGRRLQPV